MVALLAIFALAPLGALTVQAFLRLDARAADALAHFNDVLAPEITRNTLTMLAGTGAVALVVGTALAWVVTSTDFRGRRLWEGLLLAPLALPSFVLAYSWIAALDWSGPVGAWLRNLGLPLPAVRSLGGLVLVLGLSLYPYVYLLARQGFLTQGRGGWEAARSLGLSPAAAFFRVTLPSCAPWLTGALGFVLMEAAADYGTTALFPVETLTTSVFKAWMGLFSLSAASRLALLLALLAFSLLLLERGLHGRRRYGAAGRSAGSLAPRRPLQASTTLALHAAFILLLVATLVAPVSFLVSKSSAAAVASVGPVLLRSFLLAAAAAGLVALGTLGASLEQRFFGGRVRAVLLVMGRVGYALPGTVISVGLFVSLAALDRALGADGGLLRGGLLPLLIAYLVRFQAVAAGPIEAGLHRVGPKLDESARSLGAGRRERAGRLYAPMLARGIGAGAFLVFVDVVKEVPMTLMMRPFGWDTLSTRVFHFVSEGDWNGAAPSALLLGALGAAGVAVLWRQTRA